jgi:hypothetical protein
MLELLLQALLKELKSPQAQAANFGATLQIKSTQSQPPELALA